MAKIKVDVVQGIAFGQNVGRSVNVHVQHRVDFSSEPQSLYQMVQLTRECCRYSVPGGHIYCISMRMDGRRVLGACFVPSAY